MTILASKEMNPHNRKVEAIGKFWGFYGAIFPLVSKKGKPRYFKSDLIVDISHLEVLIEQLDCCYIWVEVVKESPSTPDKKEWLRKMLSEEWLILEYGYGESFTPHRPLTYKGKGTSEETKKVLHRLIQQCIRLKQMLRQTDGKEKKGFIE